MDPLKKLVTVADLQQAFGELIPFIGGLLLSVGISAFLLGLLVGYLVRLRFLDCQGVE